MSKQAISERPISNRDWALYAHHRTRLTEAILSSITRAGGRLCVLGAGYCNDLDLERLSVEFSEIHLVDIDAAALGAAVARQTPIVRSRLRPHAKVDLSGLSGRLGKWKRRPPTLSQVHAAGATTTQGLLARLPGPFDLVVSACVLTQMAFAARDQLGDAHPMLPAVRLSLIATHVHTLVGLTAIGGSALFVCDLSSSSLFPLHEVEPTQDLREVMGRIVGSGRFYHAANPAPIEGLLTGETFCRRVAAPTLLDPWLWTGRLDRTYFVYALRIPRHA
jgi:hypothetical protein